MIDAELRVFFCPFNCIRTAWSFKARLLHTKKPGRLPVDHRKYHNTPPWNFLAPLILIWINDYHQTGNQHWNYPILGRIRTEAHKQPLDMSWADFILLVHSLYK
jgi:hypothetical protein